MTRWSRTGAIVKCTLCQKNRNRNSTKSTLAFEGWNYFKFILRDFWQSNELALEFCGTPTDVHNILVHVLQAQDVRDPLKAPEEKSECCPRASVPAALQSLAWQWVFWTEAWVLQGVEELRSLHRTLMKPWMSSGKEQAVGWRWGTPTNRAQHRSLFL